MNSHIATQIHVWWPINEPLLTGVEDQLDVVNSANIIRIIHKSAKGYVYGLDGFVTITTSRHRTARKTVNLVTLSECHQTPQVKGILHLPYCLPSGSDAITKWPYHETQWWRRRSLVLLIITFAISHMWGSIAPYPASWRWANKASILEVHGTCWWGWTPAINMNTQFRWAQIDACSNINTSALTILVGFNNLYEINCSCSRTFSGINLIACGSQYHYVVLTEGHPYF